MRKPAPDDGQFSLFGKRVAAADTDSSRVVTHRRATVENVSRRIRAQEVPIQTILETIKSDLFVGRIIIPLHNIILPEGISTPNDLDAVKDRAIDALYERRSRSEKELAVKDLYEITLPIPEMPQIKILYFKPRGVLEYVGVGYFNGNTAEIVHAYKVENASEADKITKKIVATSVNSSAHS